MFLKYFGLSLPADNRETLPLKELTVKQGSVMGERQGTMPVKRKIQKQDLPPYALGSRSGIVWKKWCLDGL